VDEAQQLEGKKKKKKAEEVHAIRFASLLRSKCWLDTIYTFPPILDRTKKRKERKGEKRKEHPRTPITRYLRCGEEDRGAHRGFPLYALPNPPLIQHPSKKEGG